MIFKQTNNTRHIQFLLKNYKMNIVILIFYHNVKLTGWWVQTLKYRRWITLLNQNLKENIQKDFSF